MRHNSGLVWEKLADLDAHLDRTDHWDAGGGHEVRMYVPVA